MQLFSADEIVFSKKKLGSHYDPENMKKTPSIVAHNHSQLFYVLARLPKQKSHCTKGCLIQDWVFRLGSLQTLQRIDLDQNLLEN